MRGRRWIRAGQRLWRVLSWRLRRWRRALEMMAGLVTLGGFVWLFGWLWWKGVPILYQDSGAGPDARVQAVTGTRTALLVGLAGVGAVGALWFNNRTYRLTQQGQITDRYTKAIEQLGDEKLDVRLGGIYALERIAVDSERDHPTVVEVLSAFVRERADASRPENQVKARLATDIQAVLTVLSDLPHRLSGRGDLEGALLTGAELGRADLSGAWLEEVNLSGAQLSGANLSCAQLRSADLSGANLVEADLSGAELWGANLSGAQLRLADLSGAQLRGANLSRAQLWRADLSDAPLKEADLSGAELWGANLSRAGLWGANLEGANLEGANLRSAIGLRQEQLDTTTGNVMTQLPDGVRRPSAWAT